MQSAIRSVPRFGRPLQQRRTASTRPLSPHLTIYSLQLTNLLSGMHRMTGAAIGSLLYAFGLSAAFFSPDVAALVSFVQELPTPLILTTKTLLAAPFTYHAFNGIRHIVWDLGYALSLRGVYISGYLVLSATALSTLALVLCK